MSANDLRSRPAAGPWRADTPAVAIVAVLFFLAAMPAAGAVGPFSTFLQPNLSIVGLGHDSAGNIYLAGSLNPSPIAGHSSDVVAMRLDPAASEVSYFVYVGGAGPNTVRALAVDAQGNTYFTGYTGANDFPATSGFSGPVPTGMAVPFVIKLNPAGELVYATLYAGAVSAFPQAVAVDSAGDAIVTGYARPGYPATPSTVAAADTDPSTNTSPFVTKLDPTGTKIMFSAVGVGGSQVTVGPQGDIYLAGNTSAGNYPTTPGAIQSSFTPTYTCSQPCLPGAPAFPTAAQYVTRLSGDGTKLVYSTYLSAPTGASNAGLAVDGDGNAYLTGTAGTGYPYTATSPSDRPGFFLTKLDPTGTSLVWSVAQGGLAAALDRGGNVVVAGDYQSLAPNAPPGEKPEPPPPTGNTPAACLPNGTTVGSIVYVQRFSGQDGSTLATELLPASYAMTGIIGGVPPSTLMVEPDGRAVVAGSSLFPDVPITPGVVFSSAAAQRQAFGAFLASFDLSQTALGPQLACVADSADFELVGPVAPGQLVSLYGYQLGAAPGTSAMPPLTLLNGVQVTFDGTPAPLLYAGPGQVNVQVPFVVAGQVSTVMTIAVNGNAVATRMFAVAPSNPALFLDYTAVPATCDARLGSSVAFAALALNADGSKNSCANPAAPGSNVTVFLNGVAAQLGGQYPASGSITGPNPPFFGAQVDARGGVDSLASGPLYPAPGMIAGIDQVAIQLPPAASGSGIQEVNLEMSINGIAAAPFSLYGGLAYQQSVIVWVNGK